VQTDNTNWEILARAGKFTKAWAVAKTGPVGANLIFDILKSTDNGSTWTSIWATNTGNRIQIAAGSNSGSQTSFDTTTFAASDLLRIDIVQVGSTTAGSDISIVLETQVQNT
jgi:hypothetical protein